MAEASIPVDLTNPGQVFACLGFMEAADVLLGEAEGGFNWSGTNQAQFHLTARGDEDPVGAVLAFLAEAEIRRFAPIGYSDPPPKKGKKRGEDDDEEADGEDDQDELVTDEAGPPALEFTETFPAKAGDRMTLPIRLGGGNRPLIELGHWADGLGRESFKLYSGNRSAAQIARAMLKGVPQKMSKGIAQLWEEDPALLVKTPFDVLTPMGGSFNFDPRGAWTAIDAGYSPNDQKHQVAASPVVEFLAAWGLEHARPVVSDDRQVRYVAWGISLPPILARAALIGAIPALPTQHFRFLLDSSGKNKIVTFAEREIQS
jgi:CRISPR-associated protein Csb3